MTDRPEYHTALPHVESILDVAERNSLIEGLPPFDPAFRRRMRRLILDSLAERPHDRP